VYSSDLEKYDITNEPWASGGTALVIGNGPSANIVFKHGPGLLKKIDKKTRATFPGLSRIFICNDISKLLKETAKKFGDAYRPYTTLVAVSTAFNDIDYTRKVLHTNMANHVISSTETFDTIREVMLEDGGLKNSLRWHSVYGVEESPISFNMRPPFCSFAMSHLVTFQFIAMTNFSNVLLAGFDLGYKPLNADGTDPNHFSSNYWGEDKIDKFTTEYLKRMEEDQMIAHSMVYANMKRRGINVYNTTRGPLDAFYGKTSIW